MSAHVSLNLFNELRKAVKCEACQTFYRFSACRAFYRFLATSLIISIIQEHEC